MERRVVITGLGVVSPVGTGVEKFWNSLLEGKSGIAPITRFDAADFPVKIAGEVKDFDPALAGDKKTIRHMDRNAQFAVAAARMAVEDAKLDMEKENPDMAGTVIGTGIGGIATMEETVFRIEQKGPGKVNPFAVPMMIANMASGQVSITFGLQGPVLTDVTACASGTNAIGLAARLIKHGDADVMIAGGTEAAVAKTPMAGFAAMKALSSRECPPEEASCPFDARRDGFVLGEGAGILVLEELEHAKKRGAYIYAELAGYGSNGDAYHITAPRPGGEVARHLDGDYLSVYVPTTPNPTSGFFLMVPRADVIELAMSVDEALKYVISMGVVVPPLREPRPGEPVTAQVPGVTGPKAAAPAAEALPPVNHPMVDPAIARPEL